VKTADAQLALDFAVRPALPKPDFWAMQAERFDKLLAEHGIGIDGARVKT
jgi:hypothetical protein